MSLTVGDKRLPLRGIRVIDFGWVVAMPAATKALAQYGAEVIKVESSRRVDGARATWPMKDRIAAPDRSAYFAHHNSSKLSVTLDLTRPEAVAIAKELVATADVVTENLSPGVMGRWGLGYDELRRVAPGIVMVSATTQGKEGPFAGHPGFGMQIQATAGFNEITGWPDRAPLGPQEPYLDLVQPWFVIVAVLSALDHRLRTGEGSFVDVSMIEAGLHFIAPQLLDYTVNGRIATRAGNRVDWAVPHGVFRCNGEDAWVAIAAETDAHWAALVAVACPQWRGDAELATLLGRKAQETEIEQRIEAWTVDRTPAEVQALLAPLGVPCSPVENGADLGADPQLAARGHLVEVEHPVIGRHPAEAPSFLLGDSPPAVGPAPLMGQHNAYVLCQLLGRSGAALEQLQRSGIVA
jgi:crotonobetainyl-CoA:carnitine CoA-transferase CaiB-like acyl-CoA transferase